MGNQIESNLNQKPNINPSTPHVNESLAVNQPEKRHFILRYFLGISVINLLFSIVWVVLYFTIYRATVDSEALLFTPLNGIFLFFEFEILSFLAFLILYFIRIKHIVIFLPAIISIFIFILLQSSESSYWGFLFKDSPAAACLMLFASALMVLFYIFSCFKSHSFSKDVSWKLLVSVLVSAFFVYLSFVPNNIFNINTTARNQVSIEKIVPASQFNQFNLSYEQRGKGSYFVRLVNKGETSFDPTDQNNINAFVSVSNGTTKLDDYTGNIIKINNRDSKIDCAFYSDCFVYFSVANEYSFSVQTHMLDGKTPAIWSLTDQAKIQNMLKEKAISIAKTVEANSKYLEAGL
jgi:hypothetical protein